MWGAFIIFKLWSKKPYCLPGQFAFIHNYVAIFFFFLTLKLCNIPRSHKYWPSQSGVCGSKTAFRAGRIHSERAMLSPPFYSGKSDDPKCKHEGEKISQMGGFSLRGV